MSVAVPASQSVGPDGLYAASSTVKVDPPKITAPEESGRQPDSREQNSDQPQDQLSRQLQVLAQRAERMNRRERELQQEHNSASATPKHKPTLPQPSPQLPAPGPGRAGYPSASAAQGPLDATPNPEAPPSSVPSAQAQSAGNDPLKLAQEKAQKYRDMQPGPAEIYGLPDALARYDSNGDGRIDQSEMKQVSRAKDQSSSYAGLGQTRFPTAAEVKADTQAEQPKKLYADEPPPPLPLPEETGVEDALAKDAALVTQEEVLLPGEKRLFEHDTALPRRLYEPTEDPPAKTVTGTYQQVANGLPDHTSIVT